MQGGLNAVLERAHHLQLDIIALHSRNPRSAKPRRITAQEAEHFRKACAIYGYAVYLAGPNRYNFASKQASTRAMTSQSVLEDWQLAKRLSAEALIIRPGSHTGDGFEVGLNRLVAHLLPLLQADPTMKILLENPVGAGSEMGATIAEMARILEALPIQQVQFCLNPGHLHLAGYEVVTTDGWLSICDEIEEKISWDRVGLIMLTDTSSPQGSRREEICNIGEGYIGQRGLRNLGAFEPFWLVPMLVKPPAIKLATARHNLMTARIAL